MQKQLKQGNCTIYNNYFYTVSREWTSTGHIKAKVIHVHTSGRVLNDGLTDTSLGGTVSIDLICFRVFLGFVGSLALELACE